MPKRPLGLPHPKSVRNIETDDPFAVKKSALTYNATKRIKELAKPVVYIEVPVKERIRNPYRIKSSTLKAIPTERVKTLALPKKFVEIRMNSLPQKVPVKALRAKASKRTKELARPKYVYNSKKQDRADPFKVAPSALKAKMSERINELAKPKYVTEKFVRGK